MYRYIIVLLYLCSNIIDSVLALANKRQKGDVSWKIGHKGMAIFMHSIAIIS